jgi:hypothetical protein
VEDASEDFSNIEEHLQSFFKNKAIQESNDNHVLIKNLNDK